jgi:GDP-D-mannose dehydratase
MVYFKVRNSIKPTPNAHAATDTTPIACDPSKAKQKLGWFPEITVQEMCKEMVAYERRSITPSVNTAPPKDEEIGGIN